MFELIVKRLNQLVFGDVNRRIRRLQASVDLVERKMRARRDRNAT